MKTWILALACIGTVALAQAQQPAPPANMGAIRAACKDDIKKLCADVKPGGGRIKDCMVAHKDELSPACRDSVKAAKDAKDPSAG
jgi:hypothetical protein